MSSNREAARLGAPLWEAFKRALRIGRALTSEEAEILIAHIDGHADALDTREAETWEAAVEVAWDVAEQANGAAAAIRVGRALEARAKAARKGATGGKRR